MGLNVLASPVQNEENDTSRLAGTSEFQKRDRLKFWFLSSTCFGQKSQLKPILSLEEEIVAFRSGNNSWNEK